ncbi:MAG: hypothetical protein LBD90_06805 [Bifidobacteriaceae bacterium]|jgi:hypothetical protein|nr:hypothetical protein [Bifidobacteriaceae bacterium]
MENLFLAQLLMWAVPVAFWAFVLQIIDQIFVAKLKGIGPMINGAGWIAFQAWALWFLIYYMSGGASAFEWADTTSPFKVILQGLLGYAVGIAAAILIFECGGKLSKIKFWATPVALFLICLPALFWGTPGNSLGVNPALFMGAATFFCIMSYYPQVPGAFKEGASKWSNYGQAALGELVYCALGLPCGWLTLWLGEWLLSATGVAFPV